MVPRPSAWVWHDPRMDTAYARFLLPDGRRLAVAPGGILGRLETAACRLHDPRVSEAHALISLRGRELRLIALRGLVEVDGREEDEVALEAGQRLVLAGAVTLEVLEVHLPPDVLAIQIPGQLPRELWAPVYALLPGPPLALVPEFRADAPARLWSTAEGWVIQLGEAIPERVLPGRRWTVAGQDLAAVILDLEQAGTASTRGAIRDQRLVVIARFTTVHLQAGRREVGVLDGLPARIVSELVSLGGPADWAVVAGEIWRDERDRARLRQSWDRALWRLRVRLRELGVREDLVRLDGRGNVELYLLPGDEFRDET